MYHLNRITKFWLKLQLNYNHILIFTEFLWAVSFWNLISELCQYSTAISLLDSIMSYLYWKSSLSPSLCLSPSSFFFSLHFLYYSLWVLEPSLHACNKWNLHPKMLLGADSYIHLYKTHTGMGEQKHTPAHSRSVWHQWPREGGGW